MKLPVPVIRSCCCLSLKTMVHWIFLSLSEPLSIFCKKGYIDVFHLTAGDIEDPLHVHHGLYVVQLHLRTKQSKIIRAYAKNNPKRKNC